MTRTEGGFLVTDDGREILSGAPPVGEQGGVPVDAAGARAVVLQNFTNIDPGAGVPGTADIAATQADLSGHKVDANAHPQIQARITQNTQDLINHQGDPNAHPQIGAHVSQVASDLAVHAGDQAAHNIAGQLSAYVPNSQRDVALGVPTLDETGKLRAAQMPATGSTPSATDTVQGVIRLTGDLTGTADDPQVVGLAERLVAANNLADLLDIVQSRQNLGLGTAATLDAPASGNAAASQVVLGNDTRLTATGAGYAPLVSPALTGTPTVPTAPADTNTGQAASTAYVIGQAGTTAPPGPGTAAAGTSTRWARQDHVHPADASKAPLASPTFTGTPAAPTPTTGDVSTKVATTAFVDNTLTAGNFITSSNLDQAIYLTQAQWAATTPQAGVVYLVPVATTTPTQSTVLTDNFNRTLTGVWTDATNHADTGQDWTAVTAGGTTTIAVNGSSGTIAHGTTGSGRIMYVPLNLTTQVATGRFSYDQVPTAGSYVYSILLRYVTGAFYRVKVTLNPTTTAMSLAVEKQSTNTGGTLTTVPGATLTLTGTTYAAAAQYYLKGDIAPHPTTAGTSTIRVKLWANGAGEPADPMIDTTDNDAALQAAAGVGVYSVATGTAAPLPTLSQHDFAVAGS